LRIFSFSHKNNRKGKEYELAGYRLPACVSKPQLQVNQCAPSDGENFRYSRIIAASEGNLPGYKRLAFCSDLAVLPFLFRFVVGGVLPETKQ